MERVLILGSVGSGKSTLARRIGGAVGLPVVHLDKEYWRPGWQPPADPAAFAAEVAELAAGPWWVIEGNYGFTLAPRLARARR